jgi:phage pi2 protein 07
MKIPEFKKSQVIEMGGYVFCPDMDDETHILQGKNYIVYKSDFFSTLKKFMRLTK